MLELLLPHAKRIILNDKGKIGFELPGEYYKTAVELFRAGRDKSGDLFEVRIRLPKRHRSTGPLSASNHYHGHASQIAGELGYTPEQMKYIIKCEAGAMGYPSTMYKGIVIPQSEADASPEEESMLIETCHRIAAENGIILKEE